jgi:hypothetical protein
MDLANLKPHTAELILRNPADDTPIGLTMQIRHRSHPDYQAMVKKHKAERKMLISTGKDEVPDDVAERQGREVYATLVDSWEWEDGTTFNGETPDCTLANVVRLFEAADDLLGQVIRFASVEKHFYANFKTGS